MKLFKRINVSHTDDADWKKLFDTNDQYIVRLDDVREFYVFMKNCYKKMVNKEYDPNDNFGYVNTDSNTVIPYYIDNGTKYVPMLFLERGLRDTLGPLTIKARGWNLAKLKFLFEQMGVERNLYAGDSLNVISIDELRPYSVRLPHFADIWPQGSVFTGNAISNADQSSSSSSRMNTPLEVSRSSMTIHFSRMTLSYHAVVCVDIMYCFVSLILEFCAFRRKKIV